MQHAPGFLAVVDHAKSRIREISVGEVAALQARGEPFRFIDVREDSEWLKDRCAGAEHLGRGVLERDVEARIPRKEDPIILYCGGGFRSALAAVSIQEMGYTNVRSMAGGIRAWRDAGLPISGGG